MRKKVLWRVSLAAIFLSCGLITVGQCLQPKSATILSSGMISYSPHFPLRVEGKQIVDAGGNPVFLRGCDKMGLEYANPGGENWYYREVQPEYYAHDAEVIADWGAELIRVNFAADWYLNNTENYRDYVCQWVEACTSREINVIMNCQCPTAGQGIIFPDKTEAEANAIVEPMIQSLEQAARDYIGNNRVIGVEINEPWCMQDDGNTEWNWILNMSNTLAQRIHIINSDLLIFVDIRDPEWVSDSVINAGVQYITEPNIVLAPHIYEAMVGFPYQGKYYPNDGGDFWTYYQQGNYEEGKKRFYMFLDLYFKQVQDIYGLPVVVTEFAGNRNLTQPLEDIMKYFDNHGWGYSYHTYYGPEEGAPKEGWWLLEEDWKTLSPTGYVFVEGLQGH